MKNCKKKLHNFNFVYFAGNNIICLKSLDSEVKFKTKGCEEFEINPDTLDLKSLDKTKINLKPVKYSVSGRIISKEKIPDLKVVAKSETRMVELQLEPVDNIGYSFNLMAYPGKNIFLNFSCIICTAITILCIVHFVFFTAFYYGKQIM